MIDWAKFNLAKQSFKTCETDGEEGLTWDEVDSCEVWYYTRTSEEMDETLPRIASFENT